MIRERVKIGEYNDITEKEHVARYRFARKYCRNKTVADIACGTGYGINILSKVTPWVDGYDKENLCGNFIIDLEKEKWMKKYDVIVSFETLEHLDNPEFFLENAKNSCELLIVSTPVCERKGDNPFHKQYWKLDEAKKLLEKYFKCEYFFQQGKTINKECHPNYLIAICKV